MERQRQPRLKKAASQPAVRIFGTDEEYLSYSLEDLLADWRDYYQDFFQPASQFNIALPPRPEGSFRLFIVAATAEQLVNHCLKTFRVIKDFSESLDINSVSVRNAKARAYGLWIQPHQTDQNLDDVNSQAIPADGITLAERLLYEHRYNQEVGLMTGIFRQSLCPGTKLRTGQIRQVFLNDNCLIIGQHDQELNSAYGTLAVSA